MVHLTGIEPVCFWLQIQLAIQSSACSWWRLLGSNQSCPRAADLQSTASPLMLHLHSKVRYLPRIGSTCNFLIAFRRQLSETWCSNWDSNPTSHPFFTMGNVTSHRHMPLGLIRSYSHTDKQLVHRDLPQNLEELRGVEPRFLG